MAQKLSASRRLATAARWPIGIGLTSWRYMWRTTPMRRHEEGASWDEHPPPTLPSDVSVDEVQRPGDGAGPMFHRRYRVRIRDSDADPEQIMSRVSGDPDAVAPTEFATFQKVQGEKGRMRMGDEFVVRMAGPWDGPVRVVGVSPSFFRLATLEGHLEAGQIQFSTARSDGLVDFTIESWAQSADRLADVLYDRLRMAKEIQLHMWTSFLERVVELSGGRREGCLEILTRRIDELPA
jgi:Domain of unknown function (DUF1990)